MVSPITFKQSFTPSIHILFGLPLRLLPFTPAQSFSLVSPPPFFLRICMSIVQCFVLKNLPL